MYPCDNDRSLNIETTPKRRHNREDTNDSSMKPFAPLNTFSCLTIRKFISNNDALLNQTFHKGVVKPGEYFSFVHEKNIRPDGVYPARPPSTLPPPGDVHLQVALGEKLGWGRVGSVYVANVLDPVNVELPPLVVKISRPGRSVNMAEEAWFYEELEQLQGAVVPRCYGLFQARLRDGFRPLTWNEYEDQKEDIEIPDRMQNYEKDVPGEGHLLSILVLERLGCHMPIGQPMDAIRKDVYELHDDLAQFGIEVRDRRHANILSARENDASGIVCPFHQYVHHWRLVDLELARKQNGTLEFVRRVNHSWLRILFDNLVEGCIIEPWA